MANNRIIYQSEALYVSDNYNSTGVNQHEQLSRIQSANYSFTVPRTDINQFGVLSRIGTINTETPTVSLDLSYYLTNGFNEQALGFYVETGTGAGGAIPTLATGFGNEHLLTDTGRNVYIYTVDEGQDAIDETQVGANSAAVIGIGNAFLTDYTLDLSVGSIPTVTVSMEGQNIVSDTTLETGGEIFTGEDGSPTGTGAFDRIRGVTNAGVNPSDGQPVGGEVFLPIPTRQTGNGIALALRPGDVSLSFADAGGGKPLVNLRDASNGAHVQSLSISLPLARTALEKLGSRFAYARAVDFPINASLTVNAIVNEMEAQALTTLLDDTTTFTISATIKDPTDSSKNLMKYEFRGCQLQDEAFSSSIGANKTVDLTFTTQIGGPNDDQNNIFVWGSFTGEGAPFATGTNDDGIPPA